MPRLLLFCAILNIAALPSAAQGDEAFWSGMDAYRAGDYDSALALLGQANDNPYLETFRLYYRADCLLRDSLHQNAAAEIERLFALVNTGAIPKNHRFVARARDLSVEALAGGDTRIAGTPALFPPSIPFGIGDPSPRAWFMASRACLAGGDSARAMEYFVNGATANPVPVDVAIFKELFHRCEPRFPKCSQSALLSIGSGALSIGLFSEANSAVNYALKKSPNDAYALLSRAHVMFKSGEPERALRVYWRVFYSTAPVSAKALALLNISSIEYHLKRYDKAAEHYLMYGMFYPSEDEAPLALDTAARIYVMGKEWKKALAAWSILRERHRDRDRIEAGLSEAVLRFWLGGNAEAHGILQDLLPRARGARAAAVLFWLMKTSLADAERSAWSDSLLRVGPRSFYASIARGGDGSPGVLAGNTDAREVAALARYAEDRRARYDTAGADSAFARHPALRAYVELLDHGFPDEAAATAYAMIGIRDLLYRARDRGQSDAGNCLSAGEVIPGRLFKLYAEAAGHGLDALSLSLLSRTTPSDSSGNFPPELWYPISYVDEIRAGAASAGMSPFLVLAIIREESRFDPDAVSSAGAIGLMQVMPATAEWHSGLTDTLRPVADDLRDPQKNIRAGIAYFCYLLKRFDGSVIGALASYNGGEGRMARWKENFEPARNPLVALELIGPRETRLYVKKVLDAHSAYAGIAREKARTE
jgi:tetratricopeptide (TPR) repeat protein